jgi:hypothetical protein
MKQNGRTFRPTAFEREMIWKCILQVVLKADREEIKTAEKRELIIEEICDYFRGHTKIVIESISMLRYVKFLAAQGKVAMRKGTRTSETQWAVMTPERYLQVPTITRNKSVRRQERRNITKLTLRVRRKYFEQMKSGEKKHEYRKITPYYTARLVNPNLKTVEITIGYPSPEREPEKFLLFKWSGYGTTIITHEEFGNTPEEVYDIFLKERIS